MAFQYLPRPGSTSAAIDLAIVCTDLQAMARFYGGVLGLADAGTTQTASGPMLRFWLGSSHIKLRPADDGVVRPSRESLTGLTGASYWSAHVDDLDAALEACVAGGATVRRRDASDTGVLFAILEDVEGNPFELYSF